MEWKPPHPRHIPSLQEIEENIAKVAEIDMRIASLGAQIQQLEANRAQLHLERTNCTAFMATFRRLPSELLSQIAQLYLDAGGEWLTLTAVCRSMRETIHGIKSLWNTIFLAEVGQDVRNLLVSKDYLICRSQEHMNLLLHRATPLPLDIIFLHPATLARFLGTMGPYYDLIRRMTIFDAISDESYQYPIDLLPLVGMPRMKRLEITLNQSPFIPVLQNLLDLLHNSSQNTTEIELESTTIHVFDLLEHPVLSHATQLKLQLFWGSEVLVSRRPILLPHLKKLTILFHASVIRYLLAPNLQVMDIAGHTDPLDVSHFPLNIHTLKLSHCTICGSATNPSSFPSLRQLEINSVDNFASNPARILLPRVTHVTVSSLLGNSKKLSDALNPFLEGTTSVESLLVKEVVVDGQIPRCLIAQTQFQVLKLERCRIPKSFLTSLASLPSHTFPSLQSLDIQDCQVREGQYTWQDFCRIVP